jgi:hypothetical protein
LQLRVAGGTNIPVQIEGRRRMHKAERERKRAGKSVVLLPNRTPPAEFIVRIHAAWQKGVESIFEVGRLLVEAKAQTEPGHFEELIIDKLPFTGATARRLVQIFRHPLLSKHAEILPPHWRILSDLAVLPIELLRARLADGSITPRIDYRDVARMRGTKPNRKRRDSTRPIDACLDLVRSRVEAIEPARRATLINRLRELLDSLEAMQVKRLSPSHAPAAEAFPA